MRIVSANFYVGNQQRDKDAQFLGSLKPTIAGIQEGHGANIGAIKRTIGDQYKTYVSGSQLMHTDVPVVYPRSLDVVKTWGRQISERAQVENIGMPRSATAVRFRHQGENFTFINTHCNAAVQNRETGEPLTRKIRRVAEWVAGMVVLEVMVRSAKKRGDHVILVGDLNFRKYGKSNLWKFSPENFYKRLGMQYRDHRLDYIGWTSGLKFIDFKIIGQDQTGSDHDWIVVDLELKNPKPEKPLVVGSLNLHARTVDKQIDRTLADVEKLMQECDVLGLQEAGKGVAALKEWAKHKPYSIFWGNGVGANSTPLVYHDGLKVTGRSYPLTDTTNAGPDGAGPDNVKAKVLNVINFEKYGERIHVGNLHMPASVYLPSRRRLAAVGAEKSSAVLQGLNGTKFLTGDFNMTPDHKLLGVYARRGFINTHNVLTPLKTLGNRTIDYVFFSKGKAKAFSHKTVEVSSDHRALVATFDLTNPSR